MTILFNSLTFLYFSIVVLLVLLVLKSKKYQYLFLIAASYYFYYYSSGYLFLLLLFSSLLDFFCAKAIFTAVSSSKRKFYLVLSLMGNLGILGFFKYTDFAFETVNVIASWFGMNSNLPILNLVLPIGISFFTFQTMSYTLDIYMKKLEPTDSILKFALYVSFFPQLVAGPIVRAADFLPQLKERIRILPDNFKSGLTLVMWGLVKKIVIGDNIANFVNAFFADPLSYPGSIPVILGAIAFAIQVYCDFSGYSDIAIGLARIMGFHFKLNFDKPFFSKSIAEFWKRWHISLSTWFRDYIFTPLMNSRRLTMTWLYFSVFMVYLISGLWHGAGWNFVLFGALHGTFLMVSMMTEKWRVKFNTLIGLVKFPRLHNFIKTGITLFLVVFSLLVFRFYKAEFIVYAMKKFIFLDLSNYWGQLANLSAFEIPFIFMVLFIITHIYTYFRRGTLENIVKKGSFEWTVYLFSMILILYLFAPPESVPFFYFQF